MYSQNTEYRIANTETHVHKITNETVFLYGIWTDFDVGKSITRAIGRGGPENQDFFGPERAKSKHPFQ